MQKDSIEKLVTSLCAIVILSAIIVCHHTCHSCTEQSECITDSCSVSEAINIETEVPQPTVPNLSPDKEKKATNTHLVSYNGRAFSYARQFADKNELHLAAAKAIGLTEGPENRSEAAKMKKQLREIKTNQYYIVEELTHSLPYLVPTAANRLDAIGKEFNDILSRNNLPLYRFRVTSILRSQEDIRQLQRSNANSIPNSPHNYGTTFDLGYWHYDKVSTTVESMSEDNLKLVLGQVLLNQQRAGHIYVKYERKQSCFHVTVRN